MDPRFHVCRLPCGKTALVEGKGKAVGGGVAVASGRALMCGRRRVPGGTLPCCRGASIVHHIAADGEQPAMAEYLRATRGEP